jgi:hypothetical protein
VQVSRLVVQRPTKVWPNSDGEGRGPPALCAAPGPDPRPVGDQGMYLAFLPRTARNIRPGPSHSPSMWARPAPPRRLGQAISLRASEAYPIQPARPARTTHARQN